MSDWQPIESAPRDGTTFWGEMGDDAVSMFFHPHFGEFVTGFREMRLAKGLTFEDGSSVRLHSPEICQPTRWMKRPISGGGGDNRP